MFFRVLFCKSLVTCQVPNHFWKGLEQSDSRVLIPLWVGFPMPPTWYVWHLADLGVPCLITKAFEFRWDLAHFHDSNYRMSCWTVPVEGRKIHFIVEAKGILEQTSMKLVAYKSCSNITNVKVQSWEKNFSTFLQKQAEGIPFSPLKCLIVGGLTRGTLDVVSLASQLRIEWIFTPKFYTWKLAGLQNQESLDRFPYAIQRLSGTEPYVKLWRVKEAPATHHKKSQNPTKILTNLFWPSNICWVGHKNQKTNNKNHHLVPGPQGLSSIILVIVF